jgi:hypothetical protein
MSRIVRAVARLLMSIIDIRRFRSIIYLPRYLSHWLRYQRLSGHRLSLLDSYPCLSDLVSSTPFDAHYFYQSA